MILLIGLATAFNFIIILWKFKNNRNTDAVVDLSIFALLAYMFSGTMSGMTIGMIASCGVSLYLLVSPPNFERNRPE